MSGSVLCAGIGSANAESPFFYHILGSCCIFRAGIDASTMPMRRRRRGLFFFFFFGGQEDEDEAILECSNITNMNYNHKALMEREADVIFMQEHKLKGSALKQVADTLKEAGWTLQCGPCDDSTKKPNAGVGAMTC